MVTTANTFRKWLFLWLPALMLFIVACSPNGEELQPSPREETDEVDPDVRVMTYNIHLANPPASGDTRDLPGIADVINEFSPDLVALQEVDVFTERSGPDVHQAKALGELTGMEAFFVKAMDVFGGGAYGIAILSRLPIVDSVGFSLPADPGVGGEMRKLALVRVTLEDGRELTFAGTHLDHRSEENRLHQGEILQKVLQREERPVILAGDFNAIPNTATVNFFDNYFTRTCRHNCSPTFPSRNPASAIDFVMYRRDNDVKVVSHKTIVEATGSDHLPVVADLKIN